MEQYKVILVDDEVEVIDVMKKKIRWDDLGFDVVGSATNGVKALELVEKLQPDVVLTDIKMPYMDGLELARKLNQDYPNIYIMLCTGFDEFEYAKEAVHLEIKEYMLNHQRHRAVRKPDEAENHTGQGKGRKVKCKKTGRLFPGGIAKAAVKFLYFPDRGKGQRRGL